MSDFDLDRSTAAAWDNFAGRLAEVVSHMEPDSTLTIGSMATEQHGQVPFVRFACDDQHQILVEAAANAALSEEFQLTAEQQAMMKARGWRAPEEAGDHATGNYWVQAPQEDSSTIAVLASQALHHVYGVRHPAFLAPDQLAEVLAPPGKQEVPPLQFEADDVIATVVSSRAHLDSLVEAELTQILGHRPLRDADGDYALRVGSTMVFVRCTLDAREVLFFSALVHELDGRSRAMEVLSDLNTEARFVRFMIVRDRVFVSLSLFAQPFVPAHLHQALQTLSVVADQLDEHLAAKLRGRTTFEADDS
ncbi:MAG: hypothetical protein IPL43_03840 [Micropruina sp.]|nr:hypothetical protein [Micropruina sp.]